MYKKQSSVGEAFGIAAIAIIAFTAVSVVFSMFFGLFLMWAVDAIEAYWLHGIPTIGYWPSVLVIFLLRVALLSFSSHSKSS